MPRVRELLDRRIVGSFVGRTEELGSLLEVLADEGPVVVHLHGIAGVGKSRLLGAFAERARAEGACVIQLDCREVEPTEAGLLHELAMASGGLAGSAEEIASRMGHVGARVVVTLDTYEVFRLMDTWLRQVFLPLLPYNVRFVLCGREAPVTAWLSDPGWQCLFKSVRLESLKQREAAELLSGAGVTEEAAPAVPGVQTAAPQGVVLDQSWQAPVPLQLPEAPQVFIAVAVQLLCGSVPDTTSPHTPSMP